MSVGLKLSEIFDPINTREAQVFSDHDNGYETELFELVFRQLSASEIEA